MKLTKGPAGCPRGWRKPRRAGGLLTLSMTGVDRGPTSSTNTEPNEPGSGSAPAHPTGPQARGHLESDLVRPRAEDAAGPHCTRTSSPQRPR